MKAASKDEKWCIICVYDEIKYKYHKKSILLKDACKAVTGLASSLTFSSIDFRYLWEPNHLKSVTTVKSTILFREANYNPFIIDRI